MGSLGSEHMKMSIILAVLGLAAGLASAWFWLRSSRTSYTVTSAPIVTATGPVITTSDLQSYLKEVGRLNTWAAALGAVSVTLSALAGIVASHP
jgi:hypothetical protein